MSASLTKKAAVLISSVLGLFFAALASRADDQPQSQPASPPAPAAQAGGPPAILTNEPAAAPSHPVEEKPASTKTRTRGRRGVEKETEGTEAPDRFEADTVIKSKYEYNGKALEADPD